MSGDPQIAAYFNELGHALAAIDPADRDAIMAEVTAHVDSSLNQDASPEDVKQVLAALGSPREIADEALSTRSLPTARRSGARGGAWVIQVVLLLQVLGLGLPVFYGSLVAIVAAVALCWWSYRYTTTEKVVNSIAAIATVVGSVIVLGSALDSMDGCYEPATEQPLFDGMKTCDEAGGIGGMVFQGTGLLLMAGAGVIALIIAVRAGRRAMKR